MACIQFQILYQTLSYIITRALVSINLKAKTWKIKVYKNKFFYENN